MKYIVLIIGQTTSIIFALGGIYLEYKGLKGLGWCIFASICTAQSIRIGESK